MPDTVVILDRLRQAACLHHAEGSAGIQTHQVHVGVRQE